MDAVMYFKNESDSPAIVTVSVGSGAGSDPLQYFLIESNSNRGVYSKVTIPDVASGSTVQVNVPDNIRIFNLYNATGTDAWVKQVKKLQTNKTEMYDMFRGQTNLEGPDASFKINAPNLIRSSGIFYECPNINETNVTKDTLSLMPDLKTAVRIFGGTGFTKVPLDLFSNNTGLVDYTEAFINCTGLTTIESGAPRSTLDPGAPGNIGPFDNGLKSAATDNSHNTAFELAFAGCENLLSIPEYLFWYASLGRPGFDLELYMREISLFGNFASGLFMGCKALTEAPLLFGPLDNYYSYHIHTYNLFKDCTSLSDVPEDFFANIGSKTQPWWWGSMVLVFENCPLNAIYAKWGWDCYPANGWGGAFIASNRGSSIFPYNFFWGLASEDGDPNGKRSLRVDAAFSNTNFGGQIPACLFKALKRDDNGDFVKPITSPYAGYGVTGTDPNIVYDSDLIQIDSGTSVYDENTFSRTFAFGAANGGVEQGLFAGMVGNKPGDPGLYLEETFFQSSIGDAKDIVTSTAQYAKSYMGLFMGARIDASRVEDIFGSVSYPLLENTSFMFADSNATGSAQAVINKLGNIANHEGMFRNCTSLDDYATIPDEWK